MLTLKVVLAMIRKYDPVTSLEKRNALDFTVDRAIEIYERKCKDEFEKCYMGQFVVTDVYSEKAYVVLMRPSASPVDAAA